MKKLLFLLLISLSTVTFANETFEKVILDLDGKGVIMSKTLELDDNIYLSLDYEKQSSDSEQYYIRVKFKKDNIMVSTGRKLLIKLRDKTVITLTSTGFEDKSTKSMYSIRWVGWKDNYVETKNLDLQIIYPIDKSTLENMLKIGAVKCRIDTDQMYFEWGKRENDDRFSWILNMFYEDIQKLLNRDPDDIIKGF